MNGKTTNSPSLLTPKQGVLLDKKTRITVTNYGELASLDLGGTHTLIQRASGTFTSKLSNHLDIGREQHGFVVNHTSSAGLYLM